LSEFTKKKEIIWVNDLKPDRSQRPVRFRNKKGCFTFGTALTF